MSALGRVWRYHGHGGICRGIALTRFGCEIACSHTHTSVVEHMERRGDVLLSWRQSKIREG